MRGFLHFRPNAALSVSHLDLEKDILGKMHKLSCFCNHKDIFIFFFYTAQELKSLFEKKSLKEKPPNSGKQSILSVRLEQCPLQLNNPFNEYSKFDGKVSGTWRPDVALLGVELLLLLLD